MLRAPSDLADRVVVIGAGIGGLAAALRLAAGGAAVTVVEAQPSPGGKMRAVPSAAGPVDAGPTVLTMRSVFDDLFALAGAAPDDHLRLIPQPVIARHWWPGGSTLDLSSDRATSAAAIRAFAGAGGEADFHRFCARADALHDSFAGPVMHSARPRIGGILAAIARHPARWPLLAPALLPGRTLAGLLSRDFRDPRLAQLFGRYATYVGGQPALSPAVLALIWAAEERGVWAVEGGLHRLAQAIADLAARLGVTFRYATRAARILTQFGRIAGVRLDDGTVLQATTVLYNGDPAALSAGLLGPEVRRAVGPRATRPRSHSAWVWSFAARVTGLPAGQPLSHHNIFFSAEPAAEFAPLARGAGQTAPSLYICAEDRAAGRVPRDGMERFEIIINAPPTDQVRKVPDRRETEICQELTFATLKRFGVSFDPVPGAAALTGPAQFAALFPGSQGSIYGRSPHGMMATFRRPGPATAIPGLWIAGGGAHPGSGVPMAALSGRHAAEAILQGRASTSRSARTAMPGGTSTASRTTVRVPSRS
jgi:1-hydroxycarotenoid 3,4-desaturase